MLDELRDKTGKKIALLAVTKYKYNAMKGAQFGLQQNQKIDPNVIRQISGFDNFFGPNEFRQLVKDHNNQCPYLLFVRSSDSVSILKNPTLADYHQSILEDQNLRRIIKANSITFNIDQPKKPLNHEYHPRINDTKRYLPGLNMGYQLSTGYGIHVLQNSQARSIFSQQFINYIQVQKKFKNFFNQFLINKGCNKNQIITGAISIDQYVKDPQNNKIFSKDFKQLLERNNIYIKDGQSCFKYISDKIKQFNGIYFTVDFQKYLKKMGVSDENIESGNVEVSFINEQNNTQCLLIPNNIKTKATSRKLINSNEIFSISIDKNIIFSQIVTSGYIEFLSGIIKKSPSIFNNEFAQFLRQHGVTEDKIISGNVMIRAKPADGSYGCYGHIRGFIHDREFRNLLRKGLKERGFYILQVEQAPFVVTDLNTQNQYNVIHRIFISLGRSETGKARHKMIGGFKSLMPINSIEAANGRNQSRKYTVYEEVIGDEDVVMHNLSTNLYKEIDSKYHEDKLQIIQKLDQKLLSLRDFETQQIDRNKSIEIQFQFEEFKTKQ